MVLPGRKHRFFLDDDDDDGDDDGGGGVFMSSAAADAGTDAGVPCCQGASPGSSIATGQWPTDPRETAQHTLPPT